MNLTVGVILKKLLCISVAFLAGALCNGCATGDLPHDGALAPGHEPGSQMTVPLTTVGTLQPTFQWTAPHEPGVSYDFIICVGVIERHGFWLPGKTAYYRGGIKTTTHTLDKPLLPNTVYVWSVRSRSGNNISHWAAYSDSNPSLFQSGRKRYNVLCPFKTPGN
jgi:hypothetical protein